MTSKLIYHNRRLNYLPTFLLLFTGLFFIYLLTSAGNTPYDYFTRLAQSFLEGKYWISDNPPWLNELIPAGNGNYYVVYPAMPAILSIPFVGMFGKSFPQQILAHLLGAGTSVLLAKLSFCYKKDIKIALWIGLLSGLGSIIWFLSSTGSSWYLGQLTASFFLTAALLESFSKKRALLVGIFLGAAYLSRLHTILSLPLFLYIFRKNFKENFIKIAIGAAPFFGFNFAYNFLRFGVIWDKGYLLIPGLLSEPWYQKGLFHPSYIPRHLKVIFASFPIKASGPPFIKPSWGGLAIWITTPAFIYAFKAKFKKTIVILAWLTIVLIALVIFMHGTTGFVQFGYRFAVDFYPFLFLLIIFSFTKSKLKWHHCILLLISVLVNLWGVISINYFGWVSF